MAPELLPDEVSCLKDVVLDATAELHEILPNALLFLFKFASVGLSLTFMSFQMC